MTMDWMDLKTLISAHSIDMDALHVYAAFAIQVAAAALLRRPLGHLLPWAVVLGFELANEALDILDGSELHIQPWQASEAVHDLVNTMLLPTAILLLARFAPALFGGSRRADAPSEPD
jgi:hypothetical protein